MNNQLKLAPRTKLSIDMTTRIKLVDRGNSVRIIVENLDIAFSNWVLENGLPLESQLIKRKPQIAALFAKTYLPGKYRIRIEEVGGDG